ncbi:glycosyltransferase family 39 protein [Paenibacillus sp. IITD108]|uniref:glycosyltransferase family 39 protein n=1 Tax=Paenibacillus sp. IITD108 TaxID=3116649 RepID=UPI002F40B16E
MLNFVMPVAADSTIALRNGNIEQVTNGVADGWSHAAWDQGADTTIYTVDQTESYEGHSSLFIHNQLENHARFTQTVPVKSSTTYRISAFIKAEGFRSDSAGAHIQIEDAALFYPHLLDTAGQWQQLEIYVKTGKKQKEITIGLSAGGYGRLNAGKAWFDQIEIQQVSKAPTGVEVFSAEPSVNNNASDSSEQAVRPISMWPIMLIAAVFSLFFYGFAIRRMDQASVQLKPEKTSKLNLLAALLLAALAIRVIIAVMYHGYPNDVALFKYWAQHAVNNGIFGFYSTEIFIDYPPGYMYVLFLVGKLHQWLSIDYNSALSLLLIKLPAILADCAAVYLIYRTARAKLSEKGSLLLALLYAFNPLIVTDSAAWGQVDSIFTLLLVLSVQGMAERRIVKASIWFAVAALVKPQAFIFMPVLLLMLLHRKKWKELLTSAFAGFVTFLLLAMPFFAGHGGIKALIDLYKETLSSYPYATLNSFNVYILTGGNWAGLSEKFLLIPYSAWGLLGVFAAVLLAVYYSVTAKQSGKITAALEDERVTRSYYLAMILIAVVFIFVTKMHERYMFPIVLLSVFAYIQSLDRRMLHIFFGFSMTNFINASIVLAYSKQTAQIPIEGIAVLCSIVNIALLLYMLYAGFDLYVRGNRKSCQLIDQGMQDKNTLDAIGSGKGSLNGTDKAKFLRKDRIIMLAITAIYAAVALINLGSTKGPVTVWQPKSSGQSFYVDLGETKQLERVTSFGGLGSGKYALEFALEPDQWTNKIDVESTHVSVFAWNSVEVNTEARYVKLTVTGSGFSMHELGIYETGATKPLPIASIVDADAQDARRGNVSQLFDEQQLMIKTNHFYYGSYFDEIYHARTAYENIEGIVAYESTHPPLGKLILAIGIKLFGLNPFGWRIAGTVLGIAMLPIIYLFAHRIFGRTIYAALAAALFAVDFMHFSQTRIATIDVYGVFFIILMFYFMHRYVQMNFYQDRFLRTLLPLGLAGLMFGLGVAAKWIAVYGGAGLAVMLALSLIDRYKEYAAAKRYLRKDTADKSEDADIADAAAQEKQWKLAELAQIEKKFPRYLFSTLAVCLIFYVAVPLAIYMLSYIPVLKVMDGGYTLKAFIEYQKNMFNYHSNLVSSHPFSSSWWEWPFMKRPVWYFSGNNLGEGMKATIVALGNPILWWTGLFAILATVWLSVKRRDKAMYTVWVAYFSQYIPWMLVTRETFLYHYFAMVPFMIISIVYLFKLVEERYPRFVTIRNIYLAAAIGLFLLFYPALSGLTVPKWYVDYILRWFPSWVF